MIICKKDKCVGCSLCYAVCPKKAIKMDDSQGHLFPMINSNLCIECGLCKERCPENSPENRLQLLDSKPECYASWNKNNRMHFAASSGGIARELARNFIIRGGAVIGVWFNNTTKNVEHRAFESLSDLKLMSNSMYVQSVKTNVYNDLRTLVAEKNILVIGVPCEIDAFKRFVNIVSTKGTTKKVYYVDLLCRGGSSSICFREHIACVTDNDNSNAVSFRGGYNDCTLTVSNKDKKVVYQGEQYVDPYFKSFMSHILYRESCFACRFAGKAREGDISLGDFWGLDQCTLRQSGGMRYGVNLLLVNTLKGSELLSYINKNIFKIEKEIDVAICGNSTLSSPTARPQKYEEFWEVFRKRNFKEAFNKVFGADYDISIANWKGKATNRRKQVFILMLIDKFPHLYATFKKIIFSITG